MADCNATKYLMEPKAQLHKDMEGAPIDATEYRSIVGCLRYLLNTRPDLSYVVGMASRYMERPTTMHYKVVKQILRYLRGTIHFGLTYTKGPREFNIFGYLDSDLAVPLALSQQEPIHAKVHPQQRLFSSDYFPHSFEFQIVL
ncbi:hypothetical protein Csa_004708 [Cucumis sativus]|nr:hypothetical protein Csa_004708 [Cucumis sativus]